MKATLYKITNTINFKIYIGMTKNSLHSRFKSHCRPNSGCRRLYNSIQKHGVENFRIEKIVDGPIDSVAKLEADCIRYYQSTNPSVGYNLVTPSGEISGFVFTEDMRASLRLSRGDPCYVMGFWFPNRRMARDVYGLSRGMLNDYLQLSHSYSLESTILHRQCVDGRRKIRDDFKVDIDGVAYSSLSEASRVLKCSKITLKDYLSQDAIKPFQSYQERRLNIKALKSSRRRSKPVKIFSVEYPSVTEASSILNINYSTLYRKIRDPKEHDYFFIKED